MCVKETAKLPFFAVSFCIFVEKIRIKWYSIVVRKKASRRRFYEGMRYFNRWL